MSLNHVLCSSCSFQTICYTVCCPPIYLCKECLLDTSILDQHHICPICNRQLAGAYRGLITMAQFEQPDIYRKLDFDQRQFRFSNQFNSSHYAQKKNCHNYERRQNRMKELKEFKFEQNFDYSHTRQTNIYAKNVKESKQSNVFQKYKQKRNSEFRFEQNLNYEYKSPYKKHQRPKNSAYSRDNFFNDNQNQNEFQVNFCKTNQNYKFPINSQKNYVQKAQNSSIQNLSNSYLQRSQNYLPKKSQYYFPQSSRNFYQQDQQIHCFENGQNNFNDSYTIKQFNPHHFQNNSFINRSQSQGYFQNQNLFNNVNMHQGYSINQLTQNKFPYRNFQQNIPRQKMINPQNQLNSFNFFQQNVDNSRKNSFLLKNDQKLIQHQRFLRAQETQTNNYNHFQSNDYPCQNNQRVVKSAVKMRRINHSPGSGKKSSFKVQVHSNNIRQNKLKNQNQKSQQKDLSPTFGFENNEAKKIYECYNEYSSKQSPMSKNVFQEQSRQEAQRKRSNSQYTLGSRQNY